MAAIDEIKVDISRAQNGLANLKPKNIKQTNAIIKAQQHLERWVQHELKQVKEAFNG